MFLCGEIFARILPANGGDAVDTGSIPVKIPWRIKWQPTPVFFAWKNPMDRGAWKAIVHGVAKSQTPLSMQAKRKK